MLTIFEKANRAGVRSFINRTLASLKKDPDQAIDQLVKTAKTFNALDPEDLKTWESLARNRNHPWREMVLEARDRIHENILKTSLLNIFFHHAIQGEKRREEWQEKLGLPAASFMVVETQNQQGTLTYQDLDKLVTQGKDLGIYFYFLRDLDLEARQREIILLASKHSDCIFYLWIPGACLDRGLVAYMKKLGNVHFLVEIQPGKNLEGLDALAWIWSQGLPVTAAIHLDKKNYKEVAEGDFLDLLIQRGVQFLCCFQDLPLGAKLEGGLDPQEKVWLRKKLADLDSREGAKKILVVDYDRDGLEGLFVTGSGDLLSSQEGANPLGNIKKLDLLEAYKKRKQ